MCFNTEEALVTAKEQRVGTGAKAPQAGATRSAREIEPLRKETERQEEMAEVREAHRLPNRVRHSRGRFDALRGRAAH